MDADLNEGAVGAVSIVIVNWNTGALLDQCLASLFAADEAGRLIREVVVVDNGSTDESLAGLCASPPASLRLRVEKMQDNLGFAAACNLGARLTSGPLVLFLNPDTALNAQSLVRPVAYLLEPASAAVEVVGIRSVDESGHHTPSCARFPTLLQHFAAALGLDAHLARWGKSHMMLEFDHASDKDVEQVIGAFFMVRRSAFERLGGLDEQFFVYYEEVDFCLRIWQSGGRVRHLADATYVHVGCGSSRNDPVARLHYSLTSRYLFHRKHGGWAAVAAILALTCLLEFPARIFAALLGRSGLGVGGVLAAYQQFIRALMLRRWHNGRHFA